MERYVEEMAVPLCSIERSGQRDRLLSMPAAWQEPPRDGSPGARPRH